MSKLKKKYEQEIRPKLAKEFGLRNLLAVPRVLKIVVNVGAKQMAKDKGEVEKISQNLALITGQKPQVCRAKRSIAGFKLAKGDPVGLKTTLRRERMYDFLEELIKVVLPRIGDFQGVSLKSFDGQGNYTLGISEHLVFPEVDYGKLDKIHGLEITIVTNAKDDKKAQRLLEELGVPFEKRI